MNQSTFAETGSNISSIGLDGGGNDILYHPYGIAMDETSGTIFIADTGNSRIKCFNLKGSCITTFGKQGKGDGEFLSPQGVAYDQSIKRLFVADTGNKRIQILGFNDITKKLNFIMEFGKEGEPHTRVNFPRDLISDNKGNIYVVDESNIGIQKYDLNGSWIDIIGEEHNLKQPRGIDLDKEGNIYVAETMNHKILKFNKKGRLIWELTGKILDKNETTYKLAEHEFVYATDVAVDNFDYIYVTDRGNRRVNRYDKHGLYLNYIGKPGEFHTPEKIYIDSENRIYIVDSNFDCVKIYNGSYYLCELNVSLETFIIDDNKDKAQIDYLLPEISDVTIEIYNDKKQLVRELIHKDFRDSSRQSEAWDGRDNNNKTVPSGTYIIKIEALNEINDEPIYQTADINVEVGIFFRIKDTIIYYLSLLVRQITRWL